MAEDTAWQWASTEEMLDITKKKKKKKGTVFDTNLDSLSI